MPLKFCFFRSKEATRLQPDSSTVQPVKPIARKTSIRKLPSMLLTDLTIAAGEAKARRTHHRVSIYPRPEDEEQTLQSSWSMDSVLTTSSPQRSPYGRVTRRSAFDFYRETVPEISDSEAHRKWRKLSSKSAKPFYNMAEDESRRTTRQHSPYLDRA
eukprot:GILJ01010661.1.p1 GENE.GILJ01010661.1~~GILJ01010661.1.p1  ORF type:complete len:157 (+),score=15.48 GILJ01010661.1:165-635(+)